MRDALSLLDQILACNDGEMDDAHVTNLLGGMNRQILFDLSAATFAKDISRILAIIDSAFRNGQDLKRFYTDVLAHFLTFGTLPELDNYNRPKVFFGTSIHDRCYRRPFYDKGLFADSFDDEGAKKGWCLYKLGCKGPMAYNACATMKWNQGTSWPVESGHGCLGCSEPDFWDAGGFYNALSIPTGEISRNTAYAAAAGLALGAVAAGINHKTKVKAAQEHGTVTVDDLEKKS